MYTVYTIIVMTNSRNSSFIIMLANRDIILVLKTDFCHFNDAKFDLRKVWFAPIAGE